MTSIALNFGTEAISFGGGGAISISAPTVDITAGNINIGDRALTITASNGSLTVNAIIRADVASTGAIMLAAINGPLTLVGNGNVILARAAALTLSSTGTNSELVPCPSCGLSVGTINLTQDPAFVSVVFGDNLNNAPYAIGTGGTGQEVNLTTSAPQTVLLWMEAAGRDFSLTTDGVLTLNNAFRAGQNDNLTF